jgi:hypothetical protein
LKRVCRSDKNQIGTPFFEGHTLRRQDLRQTSTALQLALLWSAGAVAQSPPQSPPQSLPQPFSAEIVSLGTNGAPLGAAATLRAADHKVRIETTGAADSFFISDADAGTTLVVRPAQRLYLDARQSTPLTQIFVWLDPHDPCRQWQAAAETAGVPSTRAWHCKPIEHAIINQHDIIEYSVVTSDRQTSHGWVDATLGFPVKWRAADGKIFVLENISLQTQPARLFSIPPDYRKLDPQSLLERIKRSDVWADSPQ